MDRIQSKKIFTDQNIRESFLAFIKQKGITVRSAVSTVDEKPLTPENFDYYFHRGYGNTFSEIEITYAEEKLFEEEGQQYVGQITFVKTNGNGTILNVAIDAVMFLDQYGYLYFERGVNSEVIEIWSIVKN